MSAAIDLARRSPTDDEARSEQGLSRLVISCADRPGIVAAVSRFLTESGANIVTSDQFSTDPEGGAFFMRNVFHLPMDDGGRRGFEERFEREVASNFDMSWQMFDSRRPKRMAVLVSRYDHCLLDLMWRWRRNELDAEIVTVASNHPDLRADVEAFGLPYHHVPVAKGEKPAAEAKLLELLRGEVDVVVLARYMQIVSGDFLEQVGVPVINIHHSFLPAFAGAGPYQRAKERGVKLIGATSHYVTEDLDAGPIIEQDVIRVSHREDVETLTRLGADIERTVLARAVQWHCEDRVLVHGNSAVVF
jgi:formyltetrahydrofolate deformylase